jgi:hypothetical protein
MRLRAAIALFALAAPIFAQHGGGHAGSFGGRSFSGHVGSSGNVGFAHPGNFIRPSQPIRYGAPGSTAFRGYSTPYRSSPRFFNNGNRFMGTRVPYQSLYRGDSRNWNRGRDDDRDRDRFDRRRRSFANWYASLYPNWLGYPYLIDPGFYDWGDDDYDANDQSGVATEGVAPYPDEGYGAPDGPPQPEYADELPPWNGPIESPRVAAPSAPSAPDEPLTVIFKSGRAPVKMRNYMMVAGVLTDLDSSHYEQIPLNEIDVAATQRVNNAAGVVFQIPGASRD